MRTQTEEKNGSGKTKKQFCTFWLSGRLYGVDILDVKEVNQEARFTKVFHAPEQVRGLVNIRGRIHLILDLHRILGFKVEEQVGESRLVLFKPSVGEAFGVLVDGIGDVIEVEERLIDSGELVDKDIAGSDDGPDVSGLISSVCRLEETLLLIINARNLLKIIEKN